MEDCSFAWLWKNDACIHHIFWWVHIHACKHLNSGVRDIKEGLWEVSVSTKDI